MLLSLGLISCATWHALGWQREYQLAEDELADPRSLALRDWEALERLAAALAARSADQFGGWGDVVEFTACSTRMTGQSWTPARR